MEHVIEKARVLIEALPYIQRFRDETIVVKFGGSMMNEETQYANILKRRRLHGMCRGCGPLSYTGAATRSLQG